jgi:hypothetical protein
MTDCNTQLDFPFFKSAALTATFDGGDVVTDPGLLLVRQVDEDLRFTESLSKIIPDPRHPVFVQHPQPEMLRQRLYQIIAGYEDCNDAGYLRHNAIFKIVAGRKPKDDPLASQPTLCRLENRVPRPVTDDLMLEFVRIFIRTRSEPLKHIVLEIDPSESPTYGQQELTFFNGHYDTHMYFPMFLCDAESGFLLTPLLRAGNSNPVAGALITLHHVVPMLRDAFPGVRIDFRADSSFAEPNLLNWLDDEQIPYTIGIGTNKVLERESAAFVKSVEDRFAQTRTPQRSFSTFRYQTRKTWPGPRRIIVKCEVTPLGTNIRYVIATRRGRSAALYDWYVQRGGTIEHYIQQLKTGFEGDRLSCRAFEANQFRLLLHAAAYNLMILFRERTKIPEIQHADIHTIRRKLIKVGAVVKQTVRRVWVHFSSTWPFTPLFRHVHAALVPQPSG